MQYAIFDTVTQTYYCEDGSWLSVNLKDDVINTDKDIALFRDDDKAIAKIVTLKEVFLKIDPGLRYNLELHSLNREVCYVLEPVLNEAVLKKVEAVK